MNPSSVISYSTLVVDWGGVCLTDGTSKFIDGISKKYNVSQNTVRELLNGSLGSMYRCGLISYDYFWDTFTSKIGVDRHDKYNLSEWWNSYYTPQTDVLDLLKSLKGKYRLLYLSDNLRDRVEYLNNRYGISDIFDGGVFSFEVGCRKPSPEIYNRVLSVANEVPCKCVYIDDQAKFLSPAKEIGMKTILYTTYAQLKKDIEGVLV